MTTPTNEQVIEQYLKTREKIKTIRAKAEELIAAELQFQANRETFLLQTEDAALFDFMTDLYINGRDGKAATEAKRKDIGMKQAEIEKWLMKMLDKLKSTGFKTAHGTVYPTRKEGVSVADWDAFLDAEILTPQANSIFDAWNNDELPPTMEGVKELLRAAHLEFINKGVNKTSVLERMGDLDEKKQSRPNPPPAGVNYTAIKTVGVRKS